MTLNGSRLLSDIAFNNDLDFYVNGMASEFTDLTSVYTNADPYVYARIGVGSDDMGGYFEGLIDNVMIFDRALSGAEVQSLADAAGDNVLSVTATVYDDAGNL
ncbi:LamG-like jellyroll fold domain-containing protein, partial [Planctomycetota bacterium]